VASISGMIARPRGSIEFVDLETLAVVLKLVVEHVGEAPAQCCRSRLGREASVSKPRRRAPASDDRRSSPLSPRSRRLSAKSERVRVRNTFANFRSQTT
jgi:hypothetical protein